MVSFWSSSCLIASAYLTVLTPLFISFKLSTAVALSIPISLAFSYFIILGGGLLFSVLH